MKKLLFVLVLMGVFLISGMAYAHTILNESFDNLANWNEAGQPTPGKYFIENGVLVSELINSPQIGNGALEYIGDLILPNSYEITYNARLVTSGNPIWGGSDHLLIFHTNSPGNHLQAGWRQNEYDDFFFSARDGDQWSGHQLGPYNFDETSWHTVRINRQGSHFQGFINDVLVFDTVVPFMDGYSGGMLEIYASHGRFEMDNLLITTNIDPVPEPTTMLLLGTGLAGLAGFRRRLEKRGQVESAGKSRQRVGGESPPYGNG